jgi:futalosine hydrolase
MNDRARILVVAATARELAVPEGWLTLQCGVGPVEAAARTAAAIAALRPAAVLQVVIGAESRYCDSNVPAEWAPSVVPASAALLHAVQRAFPNASTCTIGTSARVGGTSDCDVEAMEGFGVLRAAQLAGVPAIEVRAISNEIEEADRARWHFDAAFASITGATPQLVRALQESMMDVVAHA